MAQENPARGIFVYNKFSCFLKSASIVKHKQTYMNVKQIPDGIDDEFIKEQKKLAQLVCAFDGKIIGWNEHIGVYELVGLGSGSTDGSSPSSINAVGQQKFELERDGNENYMRFSYVSRQLRWLQGEILTILEATIDDDRKLKAVKDLVKDKISAKLSWIYENCGTPEEEQDSLVNPEE